MNDIVNDDSREERETSITGTAGNRGMWVAWTNDPVMDRLFRKRGCKVVREYMSGDGKQVTARTFQLNGNQVSIRTAK